MRLSYALALLPLTLVAGCENADGSIGRPGSPAWFMSATPEQEAAYFGSVCNSYGFAPGTCMDAPGGARRFRAV